MLDPRPSASAPSGQTASSDFLQEPTASRPVRKPGTYGFSRLTSVSRMRTSLSLTAFPSSTAVSPGWMPSLAAQAAGIRSLFLKPSSRLSTSGKAVGCKVRLRLVFPYCPLSPLRKCAPLALRHCGRRLAERIAPCSTPLLAMSDQDAPFRRFLPSATARSRPDMPQLRLACSRPR